MKNLILNVMKIRIKILVISLLLFSTMYSCKSPQEKFFKKVQKYEALQSAKLNEMASDFFYRLLPYTKEGNYLEKYGGSRSGYVSGTASFRISSNTITVNYSQLGYSAEEKGVLENGILVDDCGLNDKKGVYYPLSYQARWRNISNAGSGDLVVSFKENVISYNIFGDGNWRHYVDYEVKDTIGFKNLIRQTLKDVESVRGIRGYLDRMCKDLFLNPWEYLSKIEDGDETIMYPSSWDMWHESDNQFYKVSSIIIAKRVKGMNSYFYSQAKGSDGILSKGNYIEKEEEFIMKDSSIYDLEGNHVADCKIEWWSDDPGLSFYPIAIIVEAVKDNNEYKWVSGYYHILN